MTRKRPRPFGELRSFLQRFGFEPKQHPDYAVFEHPAERSFAFRFYRDDEPVVPRVLMLDRLRPIDIE